MLGSRTKQINSYGKRNQRIVNVSEERNYPKMTTVSGLFDDLAPAPQWSPIVSRMKKRENTVFVKSKSPSPHSVRAHHKKRILPAITSSGKIRMQVPSLTKPEPKDTEIKPVIPVNDRAALSRAPLGLFPSNVPGSPAASGKPRKKAVVTSAKGTPLGRLSKPFVPYVDVDIIVMDDDGHTISKERRVSRTGIRNHLHMQEKPNRIPLKEPPEGIDFVESSVSDVEYLDASQYKPRKRPAKRVKPARVYSDESDVDEGGPALFVPSFPKVTEVERNVECKSSTSTETIATKPLQTHPSPLEVEAVIPPSSVPIITNAAAVTLPSQPILPTSAFPLPTVQHCQSTRYQYVPSPIARPRQLTPIRGGRRQLFEPPSPPSPSTPTDLDLDFSNLRIDLGLSPSQDNKVPSLPEPEIPKYLRPLLAECHQETCGLHEFSAFIDSFPFDPIVRPADGDKLGSNSVQFRKIGEASYSEVFGIGDVVLKVIPLRDESPDASGNKHKLKMSARCHEHAREEDGPAPSDAKDVLKEIIVTQAIGELCHGFVKLLRTYVVRGRYPQLLLELWDEFYQQKGSESVRPDTFNVSQAYAIIVLPNGGPDLETYTFTNANKTGWKQACSIFWQVTKALAQAEQLVSFEHRDLHWGQILVKDLPVPTVPPLQVQSQNQRLKPKSAKLVMDDPGHGVKATLIDLGLARMDAGDGAGGELVHWTPIDEEVFMGEGDYQFDVYRMMREHHGGDWEAFNPLTNVMWLHYLTLKLLHSKRLRIPVASRKGNGPSLHSATFSERDCYDCLVDLEDWFSTCVAGATQTKSKATTKGKGKRKPQVPGRVKAPILLSPLCAGEIVEYGVKKGWITSPS